jgi:PAS domain S-box-containing protein
MVPCVSITHSAAFLDQGLVMRNVDELESEFFGTALERADVGLCVIDDNDAVVIYSRVASVHFAIPQEKLLGQPVAQLLDGKTDTATWLAWFRSGAPGIGRTLLTGHEPNVRSILLRGSKVERRGVGVFTVITSTDVTAQRLDQQAASDAARQWQAMNAGVVIVDATSVDMPILYVNPAFEKMSGYLAHEAIGRNCRFLQGAYRDQPALAELRAAIAQQRNGYVVLRNVRKDGSEFLNELFISPARDDAGKVTHFIGVQHELRQDAVGERSASASAGTHGR